MKSRLEIREFMNIAEVFVEKLNKEEPFHPNYKYSFDSNPIEFYDCWYFDFLVIPKKDISKDNLDSFGGAPGFIISKQNKEPQIIGFSKKHELEERQNRFIKLNELIKQFDKGNWQLARIKEATGIKPKEALEIKRKFQFIDLSKESNKIALIEEIENLIKENNDH